MKEKGSVTNREYRQLTGLSDEGARRDLNELVGKGILHSEGKGRGVRYILAPSWRLWHSLPHRPGRRLARPAVCPPPSSGPGDHPLHRTHARIQRTQRGAYRQGAWATSTRRVAEHLWSNRLPTMDPSSWLTCSSAATTHLALRRSPGSRTRSAGLPRSGAEQTIENGIRSRRGVHYEQPRPQ